MIIDCSYDPPPVQLPDDVNLEEARMLEAAMLGRPYQGRIPDFANQPPPRALSPGAASRQMLRQEQDDAYEVRADVCAVVTCNVV